MAKKTFFLLLIMICSSLFKNSHSKLSFEEEVKQIRELATMIKQTDNSTDLIANNIFKWLQGKYDSSSARKARQQSLSREYLPSFQTSASSELNKPRPFQRPHQIQSLTNEQDYYSQSINQPNLKTFENSDTSKKHQFNFPLIPSSSQENAPFHEYELINQPSSFSSASEFTAAQPTKQSELSRFNENDDPNHPPHIHNIDVQCAKNMMTIAIEFNKIFNGVIYSKGFYNLEKCRYVKENSNQQQYNFTVSLDSCGTQFIDQFNQGGQAYLENVLVLQNEPGIQEIWDTVRSVRCIWEGSIKQDLSVSLAIGMLTQEVVNFNGDTGRARLDIQIGKGPFAPPANGLVKIGEIMTLVVYVEGDASFDVIVRQCRAKDSSGENSVQLFDSRGCVLKPKLFGAFQKTKETGNTGASVIAYSYFSAFKFPDEMDLVIECKVELCKTNCEICPEEQKLDPGRKRRDVNFNETFPKVILENKISGRFKVIASDDLTSLYLREQFIFSDYSNICLPSGSFFFCAFSFFFVLLFFSIISIIMWIKSQKKLLKIKSDKQ